MSIDITTQPDAGPALTFDGEPDDTDRPEVYLDGTLVLVGCGAQKRDPSDPTDLHVAAVGPDEQFRTGTGPAWRAEDLYTHWYFNAKAEFAALTSAWAGDVTDAPGWAILSAEHGVLLPEQRVRHYDTTIDDLGGDETNPDHHVRNVYGRRRPDGREIVTERDRWAAQVAYGLARWQAAFRETGALGATRANTLLVLAGQDYIEPLRQRGVFEYGIAKMAKPGGGGPLLPVDRTRFLFEELDAGGIGEQGSWLHEARDVVEQHRTPERGTQQTLGGERP